MGTVSRAEGYIEITPPLNWGQLKNSPHTNERNGVYLHVESRTEDTETGENVTKSASDIVATGQPWNFGNIEYQIRRIVEDFPKHKFNGLLKFADETGDLWGVLVENNVVTSVKPSIVWPGEAP